MRQKSGLTGKTISPPSLPLSADSFNPPLLAGWGEGEEGGLAPLNRDWDSERSAVYPSQGRGEGSVCPRMDNWADRHSIQTPRWHIHMKVWSDIQTLQELRMLSSVTLSCQVTTIVSIQTPRWGLGMTDRWKYQVTFKKESPVPLPDAVKAC